MQLAFTHTGQARVRVGEGDRLRQQLQGLAEVFGRIRAAQDFGVESVAFNRQTQGVHVHPQLVAFACHGFELVQRSLALRL